MPQATRFHLCRYVSIVLALLAMRATAQEHWPVSFASNGYTITVYQPQPEAYAGNDLTARAAVSIEQAKGGDPVFGAIWAKATLEVDRTTRMATISEMNVTDARFPSVTDTAKITQLKKLLATELPKLVQPFSVDRLVASLETEEGGGETPAYKNDPPKIIFSTEPSILVLIDGEPRFEVMDKSPYERVVNTPFLIAREKGKGPLFLNGSGMWFESAAVQGPWVATANAPKNLQQMVPPDTTAAPAPLDAAGKPIVPKILVSTVPAELLQTNGKPSLVPLEGTQLLFVTNTDDDIFMDINSQQYFILLSGRWFMASKLEGGTWSYVATDRLPGEFAKIPEGSPKENVLISVPGTTAAKEAVLDASIPQTAKVDLTATTTSISFDGDPKWKLIEGTTIYEAENASTTVLYIKEHFYACENAVWYHSDKDTGPWKVCTKVPEEVQSIPPSSPSYNVRYVQIYDATPTVVYVGYTPAYTGCYVYGGTVIYGTGYYYYPWYGAVYYPRPCTYGFSMHYNPWTGWSMGIHYSSGWFHVGIYGGHYGGCWGPHIYRPPFYHPPHHYHGGYYGHGHGGYHGGGYHGGGNTINIDNSTNINVGDRGGIYGQGGNSGVRPSTRPAQGSGGGTPGGAKPAQRPSTGNSVLTDKQGNVYRDKGGSFQQMQPSGKWGSAGQQKPTTGGGATRPSGGGGAAGTKPTGGGSMSPGTQQQLNRDMQNRQRGEQRSTVNQQRQSAPSRSGAAPAGGNTSRGTGGGGRR